LKTIQLCQIEAILLCRPRLYSNRFQSFTQYERTDHIINSWGLAPPRKQYVVEQTYKNILKTNVSGLHKSGNERVSFQRILKNILPNTPPHPPQGLGGPLGWGGGWGIWDLCCQNRLKTDTFVQKSLKRQEISFPKVSRIQNMLSLQQKHHLGMEASPQ
jgi:hypothetical protein